MYLAINYIQGHVADVQSFLCSLLRPSEVFILTPCLHACQVDYILTDSAERAECPPGYFRNTTIDPTLQQGQLTVPTKVCGLYRL